MFEEELYEREASRAKTEPGDLFHDYEIKGWKPSPRIYKILAVSAIANLLVLVVFGRAQVLTMRGCDAPFVGRVCQVLDTVYVGSILFGTEREYIDTVYERTELEDADITFIDVSGMDKPFSYPEGYFQVANPEQFMMQQGVTLNNDMTYIPPMSNYTPPISSGNDLINTTPVLPKKNPDPVEGEISDDLIKVEDSDANANAKPGKGKGKKGGTETANANTNEKKTEDATTAQNPQDEIKQDQFGVFINKRPLKDFGKVALEKIDTQSVKLDSPFKVVIAGKLGAEKDGRIILKDPKPVPTKSASNDPEMVKLVQNAILAVGDAGWFGYLDKLKAKNVIITIEQTDTIMMASVRADQPTENDAKQAASGLNTLLAIAVPAAKGDDQEFLKRAKTAAEGKTFVLNFEIPKPLVQEMIMRKLAESKEAENKPNSTALTQPGNNTAAR